MLNELIDIERGLTAAGIAFGASHPDVKNLAKGPGLRVRLNAQGHIASLERISEIGVVWTLRDGQHNGFPGLKTTAGLLAIGETGRDAHDEIWSANKGSGKRAEEVERLFHHHPIDARQIADWPSAGHRKRIKERLDMLRSLVDDPLTAAVPAVFERFLLALDSSPCFLEDFANRLRKQLDRGDEWLDLIRQALIGPIALALDVANDEFERDAGDPRQISPVSDALSDPPVTAKDGPGELHDALNGKSALLHIGNFPQPNLPGLGQTYIFSRNKDIPSLSRFGRMADASLPIDAALVRRLAGALTYLTREDGKGKTWRLIPAEAGDKPDLLVVGLAAWEASVADAIADEVTGEAALKDLGQRVIKTSQGDARPDYGNDEVSLLVLRTVDPANRKAIFHRRVTLERLRTAAQSWQDAIANTPEWLGFRYPVKGAREAVFRRPPFISPLSITPLSRTKFVNGGQRRLPVIGVTAAAAFGLFLGEGQVGRIARQVLVLLLERHGVLLSGLAAARSKGSERVTEFDPKSDLRRDALRSIAWIGALLHHLGRNKETYMSDAGFRLGQLLAAADAVHVGYCADLRNGDVPPTLLGNSVLAIAGSNPMRALSILQSRLKPYFGWAKRRDSVYAKAKKIERDGNVSQAFAMRYGVSQARRAEEVARELHSVLGPYETKEKSPDEIFKAELLLGYLAGLPRVKDAEDSINTTANGIEGEK